MFGVLACQIPGLRTYNTFVDDRTPPEVLVGGLICCHQPCVESRQPTHKPEEYESEDHQGNSSSTLTCRTEKLTRSVAIAIAAWVGQTVD